MIRPKLMVHPITRCSTVWSTWLKQRPSRWLASSSRGLESLDVMPQLCEKSHDELRAVERRIQRAVRKQVTTFKRVTDAVNLIRYEFSELKNSVKSTRDLCVRQHENLLKSDIKSKLMSLSEARSTWNEDSGGYWNTAATTIKDNIYRRKPGVQGAKQSGIMPNSTMSIIERVAFAKKNLCRTLCELDMYRRVPRTVSELCDALERDPVQNLPRAHFEYRKLVSWFDGPLSRMEFCTPGVPAEIHGTGQ